MLTIGSQGAGTPTPPPAPQTPQAPPGGATTPAPVTNVPAADLGSLTAQLAELTIQRAGLKAQWDGLRRQLDNMLQSNPSRPAVVKEWADVGSQMAKVDGQIAAVRARIAQQQGVLVGDVGTRQPPPLPRPGGDPDLPMVGGIVIALALILPLSVSYAIRMLRRTPPSAVPQLNDMGRRFDRLEQAVDAIAIEVERVSEGQRFVTKILAERPQTAPGVDGNQPLALGAGPAEPIRMPERESVRQRK